MRQLGKIFLLFVIYFATARIGLSLGAVTDFRVGIPEKYHKEIFNKFFQTKEKSGGVYPGLGLGLYISSEIVKKHHGRIWVKSKEGMG